ncbi:hypothetical protein [Clostridium sp. DJ247]|uniref:hypothetical protein n=1 Tax=Clostridium sp. DJ247 TaxID=2726188 RepID=UPI001624AEE4|nr:hypothetical protein [Clostridium sp. DJ247]MBC2582546.1 hypothetical protein [Clostridium sp. DJ247]
MKLRFIDNEKGKVLVEQDKENTEDLISVLSSGKEISLLYVVDSEVKSLRGTYSHFTRGSEDDSRGDCICLYLNNVKNINLD